LLIKNAADVTERHLEEGRLVRIGSTRYPEATKMSITMLKNWCHFIYGNMNEINREKCREFKENNRKNQKIEQVGLGYINLDRSIPSLSGGEDRDSKLQINSAHGFPIFYMSWMSLQKGCTLKIFNS
jgi:excinuclease UvrABC ATPase subunit